MSVSHEYSGPCRSHAFYIFAMFSRQQKGIKDKGCLEQGIFEHEIERLFVSDERKSNNRRVRKIERI